MNDTGFRRVLPEQLFGSGHTFGTPRHPSLIDPILSKRVCFYKSGDSQFNGLRMVINNRTFKTFDALLDGLSKKVPLPFGVRNITTPRGVHAVHTLDELEDGKSYICSDSRKVKPINLALARKKLAPWYHARPVSSRRRTVQQARFFRGRNIHKQESVLARTPKTLLVFRNGDPTVTHTVVLHKRTTPTFESILEYISELMQFHVVKLHTADGRRVDGLPGLTLCSGTVVAVGREPFRHENYNAQISPAQTTLPTKRMGPRRLKALKRSSCDQASHSVGSGHLLESVAETPDSEEQDSCLPADDDIEKSFRVNQDGSMTVEMRVRLTIKEEETIHWTTTLARSSVANQLNVTCLPEPVAEQEMSSLKSNSLDLESPAASIDTINKDKTQDNNDRDPPSLGNGVFSESNNEEDDSKVETHMESPRSAPTPGHEQIRKKQASVESMKSVTVEGIQEDVMGSYSYREQTEDGAVTEQYCMVKQKSSRPVPKPRRQSSVDANINGRSVSTFRSAGMTEIRQTESSGEEVFETVLHVYEQQTCQDNFLANLCSQSTSAFGIPFRRPATSETGQLSSHNEFEPQPWRPSTASESVSIWRAESTSVTSDLTLPSPKTGAVQATNAQQRFSKTTKGKSKAQHREVNKDKRSLDMASSPVRHKSSGRLLSRNLSSDNASEPTNKPQRNTSSQRRRHKTPQSTTSTAELEKTPLDADQSDDSKMTDDLEKSIAQIIPQPLNIANQPEMKPVLEKICYSIKSIRHLTQNKRPSCLEKSNSLPDFSSHVASTFGSSSKALLAFLSVMTLKEGLDDINVDELNANNVSCAEALKMIDSLRKCASIDDSHELKVSLSTLQQSASKQLLHSWKGFQDLSDKSKSRSSTPNNSEQEVVTEAGTEKDCGIDENVIDEIVDNLDIPERLKEELTSLSKVISENNDEELKDNSNPEISHFSTEDAVYVRDVSQDEKVHVDVSSIIKKFTDINQPKQSSTGSITKDTKDKDSLYEQNGADKCPPADKQQLYRSVFFAKDNEKQGNNGDESNQEKTQMNGVVSSKKSLEQKRSTSEAEEQDIEGNQLQMHSEENIPENEITHEEESGSDEEGQRMSSATKDLEQKGLCKQSVSSSEAGEQHSSEEEQEVECEEIRQESRGSDDSYGEQNVRGKERQFSLDSHKSLSEEEQPEVECQAAFIGSNVSVDERTCDSDVDDPPSEEEQPEVECKRLKVIIEESLSGDEEEEEEHLVNLPDHREQTRQYRELKTLIEEAEEDTVSSEEEDHHVGGDPSQFIENQDSYTKNGKSRLMKSDSLTKTYGFNADEDSGNDHSSCEEHVETEQPKVEDKPINNSSYGDEEYSSEEEHADMDRYTEESCTEYQEAPAQSKDTTREKVAGKLKHQSEETISQSVAERVILLEKQVADAQKTTESSAIRRSSLRHAPLEPDAEDSPSELPTSQSAPQSSLSFSYDSSGVITSEPEGNRVRSIRDMFLAKSATDIQHRCLPSTNPSETRAETSASGGYQSQTSCELSSSEDESARKSITKGFVRRTIERLYGKKDAKPDEEAGERRPPSAPKQKKKEHSSLFSPFHISRSKAKSELSYFNSTNALDSLSEATHCVAFNAQVGPEDRVSIDNEQWFLRENTLIRKSVSDPVGINKNSTSSHTEETCEDTEENSPYSLFCTKSELEDKKSSFSRKCTYFSLPHTSDSDTHQDDLSAVSKSSANGDGTVDTKEDSEDSRMWAERNGTVPGVADFKMKDNKVHPLMELPPDGEVVVVQPGKGQGVMSRRNQEPDMLDILYNFCGQNCPIL
ncbi:oxygen-regulated protein 1-like [Cebidichthys violaceus]|uniref:oxygen-regulated protein 1-like n=1 Tax=Cebidichthys violaceus TaxID=271503 RepID=UPI0035CCA805